MNRDFNFLITLSVLTAFMFCSCNKDDNELEPILFGTTLLDSKAAELWHINDVAGTNLLKEVGVFSYKNGNSLFMGDPVTGLKLYREEVFANWQYGKLKEWPTNGPIDFYGYAPLQLPDRSAYTGTLPAGNMQLNSDIPPVINFTVDGYSAYQTDLLLATPLTNRTAADGIVRLPFRHALTKIVFSARLDETLPAEWKIRIHQIKLTNIHTTGSKRLSATLPWLIDESQPKQSFELFTTTNDNHPSAELFDLELNHTPQLISSKAGTLLMMPQTITPDMTFTIFYTINIEDSEITTEEKSFTLQLTDASPDWRQGEAINYMIVIYTNEIRLFYYGLPGSPDTDYSF